MNHILYMDIHYCSFKISHIKKIKQNSKLSNEKKNAFTGDGIRLSYLQCQKLHDTIKL